VHPSVSGLRRHRSEFESLRAYWDEGLYVRCLMHCFDRCLTALVLGLAEVACTSSPQSGPGDSSSPASPYQCSRRVGESHREPRCAARTKHRGRQNPERPTSRGYLPRPRALVFHRAAHAVSRLWCITSHPPKPQVFSLTYTRQSVTTLLPRTRAFPGPKRVVKCRRESRDPRRNPAEARDVVRVSDYTQAGLEGRCSIQLSYGRVRCTSYGKNDGFARSLVPIDRRPKAGPTTRYDAVTTPSRASRSIAARRSTRATWA
jgi:hypothetical protein